MQKYQKLKFTPLSDKQIEALRKKLSPGDYDFQIQSIVIEPSASSMSLKAKLKLKVFDEEGIEHIVFDYLVTHEKMIWKIKNFYDSIGMPECYELGEIDPSQLVGKRGKLRIKIEITEKYGEHPRVVDYLKSNSTNDEPSIITNAFVAGAEVPF